MSWPLRPNKRSNSLINLYILSFNNLNFLSFKNLNFLGFNNLYFLSFNTAKTGKIVTEDGSDRLAVLKESGEKSICWVNLEL